MLVAEEDEDGEENEVEREDGEVDGSVLAL